MPEQHAGTGVAHDHPGPRPGAGFVTMDRAVRAGRFFKPVGAFLQPDFGIVQEFLTFLAERRIRMLVAGVAINLDHLRHRVSFPGEALFQRIHF